MADNTVLNPGVGGDTYASDDIGGVKIQRVKLIEGADGTNDGDISAANPLPVQPIAGQVGVQGGSGTVNALTQRVVLATDVSLPAPGVAATSLGKAEDAAHTTGDTGVMALSVYQAADAALAADGDYAPLQTDATGFLKVTTKAVVPGTGATNLGKAEDAVHASGDTGVMALGVRKDADAALEADGDYAPFQVDANGYLKVNVKAGATSGTEYTEDAAAAANPAGGAVILVRADTPSATVSDDGDNIALRGNDFGAAYVQVLDSAGAELPGVEQYTEDDAAPANPIGDALALVRDDALSGQTTTDGDIVCARGTDKGEVYVKHVDSIPVTNAGTFATQIDGAALTALQLIDNPVVADDAAFTPGTTSVMMAGFEADETATDSVNEGDGGAARMTLDRKVIVNPQPHTQGGLSIHRSLDLDEGGAEVVKASAGQVYGWYIVNRSTAPRYVKFYNATSATVGTETPVMTLEIPGNANDHVAANALGAMGIEFTTGICVGASTGIADNDTGAPGANDVLVNIFFK
jgi:hypothetical protein